MKLKATVKIVEIYVCVKQRLSMELSKLEKDKSVLNNIAAYRHIVTHMEEVYNLSDI